MSKHMISNAQFSEWETTRNELSEGQQHALDALIEGAEGKQSQEVQSEFESFLASLPLNFRTGLSKIVDVRNLTPEQLRGLLIANSVDGMDEVIRAAQYGDTEHAMNDRHIGRAEGVHRSSVHSDLAEEEETLQQIRDAEHHDPNSSKRMAVKNVPNKRLGSLSPNTASGAPAGRDKGKDGLGH